MSYHISYSWWFLLFPLWCSFKGSEDHQQGIVNLSDSGYLSPSSHKSLQHTPIYITFEAFTVTTCSRIFSSNQPCRDTVASVSETDCASIIRGWYQTQMMEAKAGSEMYDISSVFTHAAIVDTNNDLYIMCRYVCDHPSPYQVSDAKLQWFICHFHQTKS